MRVRHSSIARRYIYRHQYDDVAEKSIWDAVQNELTPLLDAVNAEIRLADEAGPTVQKS